jgi:hypothetical protein
MILAIVGVAAVVEMGRGQAGVKRSLSFGAKPLMFLRRWLLDRAFDAVIRRPAAPVHTSWAARRAATVSARAG